jgi:hypothetical protein
MKNGIGTKENPTALKTPPLMGLMMYRIMAIFADRD